MDARARAALLALLVVCALLCDGTVSATTSDVCTETTCTLEVEVSALRALLTQSTVDNYQAVLILNMQIAALQKASASSGVSIASLTTRVSTLEVAAAALTVLTTRVDTTESNITALAASLSSVQATNANLTARAAAAETAATLLSARVTSDAAAVAVINSTDTAQIASLQSTATSQAATIVTVQTAANTLTDRLTEAEAMILAHTTQIAALQAANSTVFLKLATDEALLDNHTAEIALIETIESPHVVGDASSGLNTTFLNGWSPADGLVTGARLPKFWKDREMVHLEGELAVTGTASAYYTVTATAPIGGGTVTYSTNSNGLVNSVLAFFQLPVGYRPNQTETIGSGRVFAVNGYEQSCSIGVSTDGYVILRHGRTAANTWVSLDGVSFRAGG